MKAKLSRQGILASLVSLLFLLSLSETTRISFAGLLIHPYLALIPVALIITRFSIFSLSKKILIPLFLYGILLSASVLRELNFGEIVKIFSGILTFLFFAQSVKNEKDFTFISIGFILVGVYLSYKIIIIGRSGHANLLAGINGLEGIGNKNAQSQFTLPAFFFICYQLFEDRKDKGIIIKTIWTTLIAFITLATAYSGNRSGYLGIFLIGLITLRSLKFKPSNLALISIATIAAYYLITNFSGEVVEHKLEQTTGDYVSDNQRENLILNSILLGLEKPILGWGHRGLNVQLAQKVDPSLPYKDPHNLYGYLFGGAGIFTLIFFFRFMYVLWSESNWFSKIKQQTSKSFNRLNLDIWIKGFIVLFLVRSLFTRELIYSPNFMGGLGLLIGSLNYHRRVITLNLRAITLKKNI